MLVRQPFLPSLLPIAYRPLLLRTMNDCAHGTVSLHVKIARMFLCACPCGSFVDGIFFTTDDTGGHSENIEQLETESAALEDVTKAVRCSVLIHACT